ncbi:MAG: hypothetical protein HOP15_12950 [Planctomycetes bacterium]|nr:hypothetical protein [Planctomycetota bacterium]
MRLQQKPWLLGLALVLVALAGPALAMQRGDIERKAFEDSLAGYRLKPPKGWDVVPVQPDERQLGLAFQMDSPDGKDPLAGHFRVVLVESEKKFDEWSGQLLQQALGKGIAFDGLKSVLDEQLEIAGLPARHRRWLFQEVHLDAWLVEREPAKIGVLATVGEKDQFAKSWLVTFERAVKSLETFEPKTAARGAGTTYGEKLAAARLEAERTKGWRVVPTPSEKFILATSSDNQKFVDEVIERLERSRAVFEEDYPPPADFKHVSIVRLCDSEEEFHRYGKTGGGTMGWFNPASTELVLYDAKDVDRNMSYAVMTHEGFHQYCHFLFGRSEAHRWFDEGHGDYYGGLKFEGQKAKITARMPGGLERLSGIREMLQLGTAAPLAKHLNFDHAEWQNQGDTAGYEQSWSIVFMLRQGMLGNVNSKVWRKEYAEILPHYIVTLRKGFEFAYGEERAKRLKEGKAPGEAEQTTAEVIELDSDDLGEKVVRRIWKEAMSASWGQIDLVQFEEDWQLYVKKYLKD